MLSKTNTWLIRLFCIFWSVFLFLDYFNNSGYFTQAFTYFEYSGLIITSILFSSALVYVFTSRKKSEAILEVRNFRNIYSYFFVLLFMILIMGFYLSKTELTHSIGSALVVFLVKTIGFHLAIAIVMLSAFSTGIYLVTKTRLPFSDTGKSLAAVAMGFVVMGFLLFVLGIFGLLNQMVVGAVVILMIIPGWRSIINFLRLQLFSKKETFNIHWAAIIPFGFILFLIALNFCYLTRPFPIGFDDMNLYMNTPKLISGYGALTKGGDAYNWSLIMSLGFIVYKSATIAILLSVVPGMLCMLVLYRIGRIIKLTSGWAIFACALFYTFPTVIWQSRNDAKVDLAALFIMLCGVLMVMEYYFSGLKKSDYIKFKEKSIDSAFILWAVVGIVTGFAFGIKYTSFLGIFGFLVFIFYSHSGKWAAMGMFFLNFALIFGLKLTRFAAFEAHSVFLTITPCVLAAICFAMAFRKPKFQLLLPAKTALIFCFFIGITFVPWAIKNISENKSLSLNSIITGKSPLPNLYPGMNVSFNPPSRSDSADYLVYDSPRGSYQLSSQKIMKHTGDHAFNFAGMINLNAAKKVLAQLNGDNKKIKGELKKGAAYTDKYEEIRRYLGYETGVIRFLSLPYDLTMKKNVKLWSADIGIILLILLPLFVLGFSEKSFFANLGKISILLFLLIASILSTEMHSGPFHLDSSIENVTVNAFAEMGSFKLLALPVYVALKSILLKVGNLLMPLYDLLTVQSLGLSFMLMMFSSFLIYYLFKVRISQFNTSSKSLLVLVFSILMTWMILSSGIFWYGLSGFALLVVIIALLSQDSCSEDNKQRTFNAYLITSCMAIWLILIVPFQFMPIRFTMMKDMSQVDFKSFIDRPFAKYAIGASTEKEVIKQFFQPAELQILNVINNNKKAKVLNVSTFLTYHIENNDERVYIDNQLGIFDRIYNDMNSDKVATVKELKRKGIKYILISLYTPTMDVTPEKSLTKKFNNMMNVLLNNPGSQLLFTNRVVERPDGNMERIIDGQRVKALYHLAGVRMLEQGSVAMFEIL